MRFLNIIDLGFQTIVLGFVVLGSLATSLMGNFESVGIFALYGGVFLGPWQMVSCLFTVVGKGLYLRWRVIHLLSAITYLLVISILVAFFSQVDADAAPVLFLGTLGFGIPTCLAFFYYYITFKSFQLSRAQAKAVA